MSRMITMQCFIILAITATEKHTLVFVTSRRNTYLLVEHVKDNYYARFHNPSYHSYRETQFSNLRCDLQFWQSMEREMKVKGTRSMCLLVEHVKDNYYARFHNHSYNSYRETYFSILCQDVKFWKSQWSLKLGLLRVSEYLDIHGSE